jgi:hypothetical protein
MMVTQSHEAAIFPLGPPEDVSCSSSDALTSVMIGNPSDVSQGPCMDSALGG